MRATCAFALPPEDVGDPVQDPGAEGDLWVLPGPPVEPRWRSAPGPHAL